MSFPYNARSKVHEYGGGSFLVSEAGLFFVNAEDQDIYHLSGLSGTSVPDRITTEPCLRFADGVHDPVRNRLIMVAERHPLPGQSGNVENQLVSVSLSDASLGHVSTLCSGSDFYAAPRLNPEGTHLAWLEWSLPYMPWETSELWVCKLNDTGVPVNGSRIAGGGGFMAGEPQWKGNGTLWFISDESGWASLNKWNGTDIVTLPLDSHEFGQPMWGLGGRTYCADAQHRVTAIAQHKGQMRMVHHDGKSWTEKPTPARHVDSLICAQENALGIAATDYSPPAILNLTTAKSLSDSDIQIGRDEISVAQPVEFRTTGGSTSFALYYPPCNSAYTGPDDESPPMIVSAHGGPTGMADRGLKLKIQYWTSRGFAWLDVDYRGSTGYGRAYRKALDGNWGITDVEDVAAGARHMAESGLADPDRLLISGSSAGGYTVLQALCHTDIFAAGASYYGIGDLAKLLAHTHKFESGYLHTLLGLTADDTDTRLHERSPLFQAANIKSPVIFFQGSDDAVVPPDQSRDMAASLRSRGTPVSYIEFKGEGHGFRNSNTIVTALESEYAFYAGILGLQPKQELPSITIDNF